MGGGGQAAGKARGLAELYIIVKERTMAAELRKRQNSQFGNALKV
jgi:hypothetical protein